MDADDGEGQIPWDELDKQKFLIVGSCFYTVESVLVYPYSIIQTRQQVDRTNAGIGRLSDVVPVKTAAHIVREEGVRGLYRGFLASTLGSLPAQAAYLGSYQFFKSRLTELNAKLSPNPDNTLWVAHFTSGAAADLLSNAMYVPVDVVCTRIQLQRGRELGPGALEIARQIYAKEGLRGLYTGFGVTVLCYAPGSAVWWAVYEGSRNFLHARWARSPAPEAPKAALAPPPGTPPPPAQPPQPPQPPGEAEGLRAIVSRLRGHRPDSAAPHPAPPPASAHQSPLPSARPPGPAPAPAPAGASPQLRHPEAVEGGEQLFPPWMARRAAELLGGAAAGVAYTAVTNPFDVVKTRLQAGLAAGHVVAGRGGVIPSLARIAGQHLVVVKITARPGPGEAPRPVGQLPELLKRVHGSRGALRRAAERARGLLVEVSEMAVRRSDVVRVMASMWREEGPAAFAKGALPRLGSNALLSGVTALAYEQILRFSRKEPDPAASP